MLPLAAIGALWALLPRVASASPAADRATSIPLANVEDMIVLPGGSWVIASSMAADDVVPGVYGIETAARGFRLLYPLPSKASKEPSPSRAGERPSACSTAPRAGEFSGHGIAYRRSGATSGRLYVVNHGRGETIEVFDVRTAQSPEVAPRLAWRKCIALPPGTVGNAVTITPAGRILATITPLVDGKPKLGDVRSWSEAKGWSRVDHSEAAVPTGIASSRDGRRIYFTSFTERKVFALDPGKKRAPRAVSVPFGPDNLSWTADGELLIGGLDGDPGEIMQACRATGDPACAFPGYVARLDPVSFEIGCITALGPTNTTTATQVGQFVWFGSSRSPRIWRAPANQLAQCPSQLDVGQGPPRGVPPNRLQRLGQ